MSHEQEACTSTHIHLTISGQEVKIHFCCCGNSSSIPNVVELKVRDVHLTVIVVACKKLTSWRYNGTHINHRIKQLVPKIWRKHLKTLKECRRLPTYIVGAPQNWRQTKRQILAVQRVLFPRHSFVWRTDSATSHMVWERSTERKGSLISSALCDKEKNPIQLNIHEKFTMPFLKLHGASLLIIFCRFFSSWLVILFMLN